MEFDSGVKLEFKQGLIMPTEPVKDPLNRETVMELTKPVIEIASPLLIEVINYATDVLGKCQNSSQAEKEEASPIFALYTHIIQMADGTQVLVSSGCGTPGNLLLRSSFEARLSLKFLLEQDTDKRAIAWLVKYYDDEIAYLEMMDPTNPKGREFRKKHENDYIYRVTGPPPSLPGITGNIARIQTVLNLPKYADVYEEYKKRKRKRQYPEWYSLFNGPTSLKKLAEHFGEGAIYKSLYYSWSKISHANEITHMHFNIRNPIPIVEVASTTVSHLLEATEMMLNKFQHYRSTFGHFQKWVAREVVPKQLILIRFNQAHLDYLGKEQHLK
ncbi:DUF5677 domain-containing protein [Chloroflexota bacterium]